MPRRPLDEALVEELRPRGPELKSDRRRQPVRSDAISVHDAREGVREDAREDSRAGVSPRK